MSSLLLQNLSAVCPTCETLNAPQAPRCAQCQTSLSYGAVLPATTPGAPAAPPKPVEPPVLAAPPAPAAPPVAAADTLPPLPELPVSSDAQTIPPGLKRAEREPVSPEAVTASMPIVPTAPQPSEPVAAPIDAAPTVTTAEAIPAAPSNDPHQTQPIPPAALEEVRAASAAGSNPYNAPVFDPTAGKFKQRPTEPHGPPPVLTPAGGMPAVEAPVAAPAPAPRVSPPAPAAPPAGPKFGLTVLAGPANGQRFRLGQMGAQLGRSKGVILFPDDPFISPLHASLFVRDGKLYVRDEGSTSGVFVSIVGQEPIGTGAIFAVGLRVFRYMGPLEAPAAAVPGRVVVYGAPYPGPQAYALEELLLGNRPGRTMLISAATFAIGQARCDWSFPTDEGMAPRHCELSPTVVTTLLKDTSGGLGTFVKVNGERQLKAQDRIRVGQQTLQVEQLA